MAGAWHRFYGWIPRRWRMRVRQALRPRLYRGRYRSWAEARGASRGYDDGAITAKVIEAARAVERGEALWDRDTVLFHQPELNHELVSALGHAAALEGGRLNVLDFGGALGSTWRQNRSALADLAEIRWSIVEQAELVTAGQREFSTGPLRFYSSIAECCAAEAPRIILLAGVLPYLEAPHRLLREIASGPFHHVIIDRTGFVHRGGDRLTVQRVPPSIYDASYPAWFFNRETFLAPFARGWRIVKEWENDDDIDIAAAHRGMHLERAERASG